MANGITDEADTGACTGPNCRQEGSAPSFGGGGGGDSGHPLSICPPTPGSEDSQCAHLTDLASSNQCLVCKCPASPICGPDVTSSFVRTMRDVDEHDEIGLIDLLGGAMVGWYHSRGDKDSETSAAAASSGWLKALAPGGSMDFKKYALNPDWIAWNAAQQAPEPTARQMKVDSQCPKCCPATSEEGKKPPKYRCFTLCGTCVQADAFANIIFQFILANTANPKGTMARSKLGTPDIIEPPRNFPGGTETLDDWCMRSVGQRLALGRWTTDKEITEPMLCEEFRRMKLACDPDFRPKQCACDPCPDEERKAKLPPLKFAAGDVFVDEATDVHDW